MGAVRSALHAGQQLSPSLVDVVEPVLDFRLAAVVQAVRVRQVCAAGARATARTRCTVAGQCVLWLMQVVGVRGWVEIHIRTTERSVQHVQIAHRVEIAENAVAASRTRLTKQGPEAIAEHRVMAHQLGQ